MVGDELVRQMRDVTGAMLTFCDVCGQPVDATRLMVLNAGATPTAPAEPVRACADCAAALQKGDVDLIEEREEEKPAAEILF